MPLPGRPPVIEPPGAPSRAASLLTATSSPSVTSVMLGRRADMPTTACRAVGGAGAAGRVRPDDLLKQPLQGAASGGAGRGRTAQPVRHPAHNRWDPHQGVPARPTRHGYLALPRLQPGQSGSRDRRHTPGIQRPPSTAPQPRMVSTCRPRQSPTARRPGKGRRGCRCSRWCPG